jgi:hypothetical protein
MSTRKSQRWERVEDVYDRESDFVAFLPATTLVIYLPTLQDPNPVAFGCGGAFFGEGVQKGELPRFRWRPKNGVTYGPEVRSKE